MNWTKCHLCRKGEWAEREDCEGCWRRRMLLGLIFVAIVELARIATR